jgi:hypothetical protein
LDIRNPGNVNNEPRKPQETARMNLIMIFDAGPLFKKKKNN